MKLIDTNSWSPNISPGMPKGGWEGIVLHFTAGASASSSAAWLRNPNSKASAHFVVGKEGEVYQVVKTSDRAWHAGSSVWLDRAGANNYTIGIEIDNPGPLTVGSDGGLKTVYGTSYDGETVFDPTGKRRYSTYTKKQMMAVAELCSKLCNELRIDPLMIVGHEHVAPRRKVDPGPAFDWDLIDYVYSADFSVAPHQLASRKQLFQHLIEIHDIQLGEVDGVIGPKTIAAYEQLRALVMVDHNAHLPAFDGLVVEPIKALRKLRPAP